MRQLKYRSSSKPAAPIARYAAPFRYRPVAQCVAHFGYAALALALLFTSVAAAPPAGARSGAPILTRPCERPPTGYSYASAVPISASAIAPPSVTAATVVVIDGETGRLLLDIDAHRRRPPASTTKMLTAALALEHGDLDRVVISETDASSMIDSSVMGLAPGMPITVRDLLYGLLLPSGNDAAIELANAVADNIGAFVDEMNAKVRALGLSDTHFENPHGLDSKNQFSSAYDLAMIARYAMSNPDFVRIAGTTVHHLPPPFAYDLNNGNTLLRTYPGADGVKIGWTDLAGWTFVASAMRNGHRVFVALMDTQDRNADAEKLLDWAWQSYRWVGVEPGVGYGLALAARLGVRSSTIDSFGACR